MKTKLSKRILSVFLAVLMVVTSIPLVAVTAFADEKSDLEAAITAYEQKMNGTVYTNMLAAYNAYTAAFKALDAYNYGTAAASTLTTAKNKLVDATNAMTAFTPYNGNAKGYFNTTEASGGYTNLLYSSQSIGNMGWVTRNDIKVKVLANTINVLLYKGENTTGFPLTANLYKDTRWSRNFKAVFIENQKAGTSKFKLNQQWAGYSTTWNAWPTSTSKKLNHLQDDEGKYPFDGNWTEYVHRNIAYYAGTGNTTDYYEKVTNLTFYGKEGDTWTGAIVPNITEYVVNYKPIVDFVADTATAAKLKNVSQYKEGGFANFITAYNKATSIDPNSYFTSASESNAEQCVKNVAAAIKDFAAAKKTMNEVTEDSLYYNEYQQLRDAMDASGVRATFNAGNDDNSYTPGSWDTFYKAFVKAQNFMNSIPSIGYVQDAEGELLPVGSAMAVECAEGLTAAYAGLVVNVTPVDTATLESIIDEFEAYELIFTTDSYNAAKNVVSAAKSAVWGSVENYKIPSKALKDNAENQAIVATQLANVQAAVTALRISTAAVVTTDYGNYSIDTAEALSNNIKDPTDYGNYAEYAAVVKEVKAYTDTLPSTDLTDYVTQLDEYTTNVIKLLDAYYSLEFAFTKVPDGTITKVPGKGLIEMNDTHASGAKSTIINFSYPGAGAIILRTKHSALDVAYGQASVTFGTTVSGSARLNNYLDSITLNATADDVSEFNVGSGTTTSNPWPSALSDAQKATYAGVLSVPGQTAEGTPDGSTFSVGNFTISEVNQYYRMNGYARTADGTIIDTLNTNSEEITNILGTADGLRGYPGNGGIYALSTTDGQYGTITAVGDMIISIPASAKEELSATTVPTSSVYNLAGTYFGALYAWDVAAVMNYAGYGFMKADNPLGSQVTVVDISYLVDLVEKCNILLDTSLIDYSEKYTADTWHDFTEALSAAQAPLNYNNATAASILSRCKTRYTNLWNAYQALKVREVPVTFNYKDANGADQSTTINVEWGKQIGKNYGEGKNYADQFNAIVPATYKSADGLYTYTFTGNWSPAFSASSPVKAEATYTAEYDQTMNPADFTAYNASVAQLLGTINTVDPTYTVADLQAIKAAVEGMTYFAMSDDDKALLKGDVQTAINAEQAQIDSLRTGLTPSTIDAASARATVEAQKALQDVDAYDLSSLEFEYTTPVTIGSVTAQGLKFSSQEALDAAVKDALNNLNKHQYTVSFNGTELGTVEYGTPVVISSDGVMTTDVADLTSDAYDGSKLLAWSYSYAAPSRDGKVTAPKYMLTAKSLGFIVKGDTYITTANATSDESGYAVKFMTNDGKVFDVMYTTDGTVTMPTAPSYAYYTFTGYDNGLAAGDTLNVSANTTVVANYTANTESKFTINFYQSKEDWEAAEFISDVYGYGERVDLTAKNAYCWATVCFTSEKQIHEYTLLSYGPSYSFYASRAYEDNETDQIFEGIVALTEDEYKTILDGDGGNSVMYDGAGNVIQSSVIDYVTVYPEAKPTVSVLGSAIPVYDASNNLQKISMVGTFAIPDGYKIVEAGILFSSNQSADMKVENVGTDGIKRFKASSYTSGNQFTINVKTPASAALYQYKGYATVMNADGKLVTVYSKAICGNVADYR